MLLIISLLISIFSTNTNAEYVSPYGAKVISVAEGGRAFLRGYDAIMINPAGAYFVDGSETGFGMNFGYSYASLSLMYAGDNGFQFGFATKDLDRNWSVDSMQTYAGYSFELSKWWIIGINTGYNFVSTHRGWDMNFGISFGPGLPTASRSGLIGAVTIRNPFENGGGGEVSGSIGYSYRSAFSLSIDNIYVFKDKDHPNTNGTFSDRYDIVFAIETYPLESNDFSMTFSGRINSVGDYNEIKIGAGFGYIIASASRFNFGVYATEFNHSRIERMTFGFSFIQGM